MKAESRFKSKTSIDDSRPHAFYKLSSGETRIITKNDIEKSNFCTFGRSVVLFETFSAASFEEEKETPRFGEEWLL